MKLTDFAYQILDMEDEILRLNREVTRLMKIEEHYNRLVDEDIKHGEKMVAGWIGLMLSDRIAIKPTT